MMAEQERQGPKHRQDAVLPGVERKNPKKGEHRCRSQHAPQICRAHAWLGVICLVPQLGARPRSVHAATSAATGTGEHERRTMSVALTRGPIRHRGAHAEGRSR